MREVVHCLQQIGGSVGVVNSSCASNIISCGTSSKKRSGEGGGDSGVAAIVTTVTAVTVIIVRLVLIQRYLNDSKTTRVSWTPVRKIKLFLPYNLTLCASVDVVYHRKNHISSSSSSSSSRTVPLPHAVVVNVVVVLSYTHNESFDGFSPFRDAPCTSSSSFSSSSSSCSLFSLSRRGPSPSHRRRRERRGGHTGHQPLQHGKMAVCR